MKISEVEAAKRKAGAFYEKAGIVISADEDTEVADFGLKELDKIGLELVVYVNTERVCAKEMVLFPFQTCPEHKHIGNGDIPGKEETFRCRWGKVFLYVEGEGSKDSIKASLPDTPVSVFHEIILSPGEQYTIMPETLHWFQGGCEGAVVSEFSTHSTDETDVFTDKRIVRIPHTDNV